MMIPNPVDKAQYTYIPHGTHRTMIGGRSHDQFVIGIRKMITKNPPYLNLHSNWCVKVASASAQYLPHQEIPMTTHRTQRRLR